MIDIEMTNALSRLSVTDRVETLVNSVKPTPQQFALSPGDKALVMTTSEDAIHDQYSALVVVEILDPELWKATWPDYEERLQDPWVLAMYHNESNITDGGAVGWFGRVELMQLTDEEHATILKWFTGEEESPEDSPDWLQNKYVAFADAVAADSPDKMVVPSTCGKCNGRKLEAKIRIMTTASCLIGEGTIDGVEGQVYLPLSDMSTQRGANVELVCPDCGETKTIPSHKFVTKGRGPLYSYGEQTVPRDNWP